MKTKSKYFKLLTVILMVMTYFFSCKEEKKISGSFEGIGKGHIGAIKVCVSIENDKITAVDILEYYDTPGYSDTVFETLPNKIIKENSLDVDVVTGATITSNGLLEAVKNALEKSGVKK